MTDICTLAMVTTQLAIGCMANEPANCTYDITQDKAFCMPAPCPPPPTEYVCQRPDHSVYKYTLPPDDRHLAR